MQTETPPTEKPYDKPEGERRGLLIVNTGDGKGKSTRLSDWLCAPLVARTFTTKKSRHSNS